MHGNKGALFQRLTSLIALLALAVLVYKGLEMLVSNYWLLLALGFLMVKLLRDFLYWLITKDNLYFYFEDYIKDTFLFMLVAGAGMGIISLVLMYMGGAVWEPLLIAALTWVWR